MNIKFIHKERHTIHSQRKTHIPSHSCVFFFSTLRRCSQSAQSQHMNPESKCENSISVKIEFMPSQVSNNNKTACSCEGFSQREKRAFCPSHTHSLSLFLSPSHTHTLSLSLSLSLIHTHTHTHDHLFGCKKQQLTLCENKTKKKTTKHTQKIATKFTYQYPSGSPECAASCLAFRSFPTSR